MPKYRVIYYGRRPNTVEADSGDEAINLVNRIVSSIGYRVNVVREGD